ncbi:hypothetical protein LTR53_011226 [Teratosphaeriaceae sp. CCFEE 6253]|nr:hypothetical protein LTR53_011226 [Teratosphaeriaceae sp. CCFEE 6253]
MASDMCIIAAAERDEVLVPRLCARRLCAREKDNACAEQASRIPTIHSLGPMAPAREWGEGTAVGGWGFFNAQFLFKNPQCIHWRSEKQLLRKGPACGLSQMVPPDNGDDLANGAVQKLRIAQLMAASHYDESATLGDADIDQRRHPRRGRGTRAFAVRDRWQEAAGDHDRQRDLKAAQRYSTPRALQTVPPGNEHDVA